MAGRAGWRLGGLVGAALVLLPVLAARAQDASRVGQWSALTAWPDTPTHTVLLPSGKVLFWPELDTGDVPRLWEPATGAFSLLARPGYNIFCAGYARLPDGRLLVGGGNIATFEGFPHASVYNPARDSWQRLPDMNAGRWYPTHTTLPSGDLLVTGGTMTPDSGENPLPQVWQSATGGWRDLGGALKEVPTYPWMFVAPDGRVFMAGPGPLTESLDTSGAGSWSVVGRTQAREKRSYGSAVMYEPGKVLIVGGADPPLASAEVIDLAQPSPAWRTVAPMAFARRQHTATLLPDGTVLVTGGSQGAGFDNASAPVLPAELWDPRTERWTTLSSGALYRGYHSVALLLPDGRVLVGGGRRARGSNAQLFSPPYLFKGPRPVLQEAPARVDHGETFEVLTPDAAAIAQVTLLKLGAATHAFDHQQRFNRLPFSVAAAGRLRVSAPERPALAPPDHYLLYLLDRDGVPSVGRVIRLGSGGVSAPAPLSAPVSGPAPLPVARAVERALVLLHPNGGEVLSPGSSTEVRWRTVGDVVDVKLELSADDGGTWTTLSESVENRGRFTWTVPEHATGAGRLRVSSTVEPALLDVSDRTFRVGELPAGPPEQATSEVPAPQSQQSQPRAESLAPPAEEAGDAAHGPVAASASGCGAAPGLPAVWLAPGLVAAGAWRRRHRRARATGGVSPVAAGACGLQRERTRSTCSEPSASR